MRRRLTGMCVALLVGAVLATPTTAAASPYPYPFRNPDLPLATRIDDLLGRLTSPQPHRWRRRAHPVRTRSTWCSTPR